MTRQRALIVDDEPDIRELLEITLGRMKLDTRSARNVKEAREWLAKESFDLCLTDMRLPDGTGLELVQHILQRHPQVPVAMITAYGSLDTAINALKAGAFDFLTKPVDLGRLRELVATALRLRSPDSQELPVDSRLLGESPPMKALRKQSTVRLVQLLSNGGRPYDFTASGNPQTYANMATAAGLKEIATYADVVGAHKDLVIPVKDGALGTPTTLVKDAHALNLAVHIWTLRPENAFLPAAYKKAPTTDNTVRGDSVSEIQTFLKAGVDGFFTDDSAVGRLAVDSLK